MSSRSFARWLIPTTVEVRPLKAEVQYPEASNDQYVGEVRIPFRIPFTGSRPEEFEVKLTYQACTETECLSPVEKLFGGVVLPT